MTDQSINRDDVITVDPDVMSGTPVFRGTRVPIQNLFDYLEGDETLEDFLDDFPSVDREQALCVLRLSQKYLLAQAK